MKQPDILTALTPVVNAFDELSIPYYIGGSVASSVYGMARATMDIDIVADINRTHITRLIKQDNSFICSIYQNPQYLLLLIRGSGQYCYIAFCKKTVKVSESVNVFINQQRIGRRFGKGLF